MRRETAEHEVLDLSILINYICLLVCSCMYVCIYYCRVQYSSHKHEQKVCPSDYRCTEFDPVDDLKYFSYNPHNFFHINYLFTSRTPKILELVYYYSILCLLPVHYVYTAIIILITITSICRPTSNNFRSIFIFRKNILKLIDKQEALLPMYCTDTS